MVPNTRTSSRVGDLRQLNTPIPVTVIAEDGMPRKLVTASGEVDVMQIEDVWIVQDEWWREEIDRQYIVLLMMNGDVRTVFLDRIENAWYEQAY